MNTNLMNLTDEQYKELKNQYMIAKEKGATQFEIFGQDCLTGFAKYWLQAVEDYRKSKGLPVIKEQKQMAHACADGVEYGWLSRTLTPKMCPRCKARLNKKR